MRKMLLLATMLLCTSNPTFADPSLLEKIKVLGKLGLSATCKQAQALKGSSKDSWAIIFTRQPTQDEVHGRRPGDLNIIYAPERNMLQIMESDGCDLTTGVCKFKVMFLDVRTTELRSGASYVSIELLPLRQPDGYGRYTDGRYYGEKYKKFWSEKATDLVAEAERITKDCTI